MKKISISKILILLLGIMTLEGCKISDPNQIGLKLTNRFTKEFSSYEMMLRTISNDKVCYHSKEVISGQKDYIAEARRRGLDCSVKLSSKKVKASKLNSARHSSMISFISRDGRFSLKFDVDRELIHFKPLKNATSSEYYKYYKEILDNAVLKNNKFQYAIKITDDSKDNSKDSFNWVDANFELENRTIIIKDSGFKKILNSSKDDNYMLFVVKYKAWYGNVFEWGNSSNKKLLIARLNLENESIYSRPKSTISSAELEAERQKRIELERKLAALEAKQKQEQQRIDTDTRVPLLEIVSNNTNGKRGTIIGIARDNVEVAEVTINGKLVSLTSNGNFKYSTFVPSDGITLNIQVTDVAGLTTSKIVKIERSQNIASNIISFDRLNPLGKRVKANLNALALIVGVEGYKNTNAEALYADRDAKMFKDYASEKLGIPDNRIKTLLNKKAEYAEILITTKDWLRRASKANSSDIYIFFAGHGLASENGKDMYLLPYDGRPRLLNDTALLRDRLFKEIKQANPRSVTVFLDTCYSGVTRNEEMLIAGRPIVIKAREQAIPDGFTLFSAASNKQISRPLEEAKHGMFSYFLMKGMEGDADANNDNKITARELHAYVEQNVIQQSSGSQTPELQGDKDRVLVQFN